MPMRRFRIVKLATPKQRLLARLLDICIQAIPIAAIGALVYAFKDVEAETVVTSGATQRAAIFTGLLAIALVINIVQWVLIASHGQSIGKKVMHIKIVDDIDLKNAGAIRNLVLRTWLNGLMIGNLLYFLVDSLLIFRAERKCLHDYIAKTKVILE